ncbi:MAG TPA: neutral/alkaline non-lysosomal ceramidase N-terminal domain-containing protein [Tepidisphaeraceae bacterium]|jgi:hypothetical protein
MGTHLLRWAIGIVVVACGGILFLGGTDVSAAAGEWSAGFAAVKITPQKPVPLAGYAARIKPFTWVDQDIEAKALALKDADGSRAVLVTVDLCILPRDVGERVRKRIAEEGHLDPAAVLLNVAHSHSAPAVALAPSTQPDEVNRSEAGTIEYTRWLIDRMVDVAAQALAQMEPATLSWSTGVANFVMNRREYTDKGVILGVNPRGPVDRSVPVLRVDGPDGKPRVILFGYACHNTTMPANRLAVSGDYEGYAKAYVQQHTPGAAAMFMTGCAGDANPYPRTGVELAQLHGQELGTEVCRVLSTKLHPIHGPLKCAMVEAQLPLRTPDEQALRNDASGPNGLQKDSARQMLSIIESGGKLPAVYQPPVEAWQFGKDLTLVALPDEVVVDYVRRIEEAIGPMRLWVAGYCQEVTGYIPSDRILREGGYETRGIYSGTGWFAPGVEDALVNAARDAAVKAGRELGRTTQR